MLWSEEKESQDTRLDGTANSDDDDLFCILEDCGVFLYKLSLCVEMNYEYSSSQLSL